MKKFMKKLAKKAEGFTLVELVVVIAILGILAGVAVPAYSGYLTKAKEAADITQLDAVKTAAQASVAKNGTLTKLTVSANGAEVVAYINGEHDEGDKIVLNSATTANEDTQASDYNMYFTSTVKLESTPFASGAVWRAATEGSGSSAKPAGWNGN